MEWLHTRRRGIFVLAVITGLLVAIVGPLTDFVGLQMMADDANDFRRRLATSRNRLLAAAIIDLAFALAYGIVALSVLIRSPLSIAGGLCVCLGSLADLLENVHLLSNIRDEATLDDRAIEIMRTLGTISRVLMISGFAVLLTTYRWSRRGGRK